ncbi:MAG: hypothetical protein WC634_03800 [archaeon]
MNSLFKYLILSTLILFLFSTASANFVFTGLKATDMNVWDANGARHANAGEDFNVIIPNANTTADVNSDSNYLVALSYRGTYVDLNVVSLANSWNDAAQVATASDNSSGFIDANTAKRTLTGTGPCASGGDYNVIILDARSDLNTFDVTVRMPTTGTITTLKGKEVQVELWKIVATGATTVQCLAKVADANFIIGPAILIRPIAGVQPGSPGIGGIDQNITILGYGFAPDANVMIRYRDANGVRTKDLNVWDMNYANNPYKFVNPKTGTYDADVNVADKIWSGATIVGKGSPTNPGSQLALAIQPDRNGYFDVNVAIPPVPSTSLAGPGGAPDNNFSAYNNVGDDANAMVVITPGITMGTDENVTVGICSISGTSSNRTDANCTASGGTFSRVSVETAMRNNWITNMQAVKGFQVQMCDGSCASGAQLLVQVAFNSDMNMSKGPQRNYDRDMTAARGKASMDTDQMPEFAMDANITIYSIKVPSSQMPILARNGLVCPTSMCKNRDGSTLSESYVDAVTGVPTWQYNATAGDGNLNFRVMTFSTYEAGTLSVEVLTPAPGAKIRTPRHGADANYTFSFQFKDTNTLDSSGQHIGNNAMQAIIYFSNTGGAKTGVIIDDVNIFDNLFVRCNGYGVITADTNLAEWRTCYFDMNRSDLNRLVGEYVIDVNIMTPFGRNMGITSGTVIGYTDGNVFFNPPLIEITDVNLNAVSHFQINAYSNTLKYSQGALDINYVIDFNMYLPDWNIDQNFTLGDYNIHFYLSGTRGALTNDLNISTANLDQNFKAVADQLVWAASGPGNAAPFKMSCIAPPANARYLDFDCNAQFDTNKVIEGMYYLDVRLMNNKSRTVLNSNQGGAGVAKTLDVNELWDINSSTLSFTVNDNNVPRARFSSSYGSHEQTVNASTYDLVLYCDDNTSGAYQYMFRETEVTSVWTNNGTNDTLRLTVPTAEQKIKTFQGGCLDYAGNISDINSTTIITFRPPGTKGVTPSGPGGGDGGGGGAPGPVTEGTETIVLVETQGTPTATAVESVLTDAGFTAQEIATATQFATSMAIDQRVGVDKITAATGATYSTLVSIKVTNHSNKKWENVKVIAEIPKALATDASHVKSSFAMKVLKADPIIEFTVPEIQVGQTVSIIYSVAKNISDITARAIPIGMVIGYDEVAPCENVVCESDACSTGTCNSATGNCDYAYKADETACGNSKECKAGTCIEKATPPAPPVKPTAPDYTMPIVAVVIIILVIAGAAFYAKKGKKKKGL